MAFTITMVRLLKSNASVRQELLALKLAQNAEKRAAGIIKGVKPTKEAKQVVSFLEKEEKRVLNSKEAKQAFEQVVKPEARYAATEDCFNRSYMLEDSFWNDSHNNHFFNEASYRRRPDGTLSAGDQGYLAWMCDMDGIREFVKEMLNIRKAQGEVPSVISQKGLRIDLPIPKIPQSATSDGIKDIVSKVAKKKHTRVVPNKLETVLDPGLKDAFKG